VQIQHFHYDAANGTEGFCKLSIFKDKSNKTIVVLTELADNTAMSFTNCYDGIAEQVYEKHLQNVAISDTRWIEHYNKDSYKDFDFGRDFK